MAQPSVQAIYAYSQKTIPGRPNGIDVGIGPRSPSPTRYLIYIVLDSNRAISSSSAWVLGKHYSAVLRRVESPVVISDGSHGYIGGVDTLVERTLGAVFQVELGKLDEEICQDDVQKSMVRQNDVVVLLKIGQSTWHGTIKQVSMLRPIYGR